ncbi:MAG: hypothetical protein IKL61_04070 [Clostridia bacterium]|nr:hypothetical protein [Clostridia bacterium]
MKKIIIALLCLCTMFCFVGCNLKNGDSATLINKEVESYDWSAANQSTAKAKAESLLARIEKLSASEQMELKSVKVLLKSIAGQTMTGSPSANPSANPSSNPSANPSANPSGAPSANPSNNPSAMPSNSPSANPSQTATPTNSGNAN